MGTVVNEMDRRGRPASAARRIRLRCAPRILALLPLVIGAGGIAWGQAAAEDLRADLPGKTVRSLKVFGEDDRTLVGDTTRFPWSAIGLLEARWYTTGPLYQVSSGTGALIGRSVVLTAGHCIYDPDRGWADQVIFIPGKNGDDEPFGRAYSTHTVSQRAWVEDQDARYDLAMIVLDEPLGEQTGHMEIAVQPTSFFINRNLNTAGYPGEERPAGYQYLSSGPAIDVQDGLIRDTMDSEPGQSGSPVWYYEPEGEVRRLVGVLSGSREVVSDGQVVDSYNVAVHIDATFAGWINDTLAKYDNDTQPVSVTTTHTTTPTTDPPPLCGSGAALAAVPPMLLLFVRRRR
ncbi:MAG: trypsin-like serine protease [Planctomycetes bacterium]|nr:trypsin-like serine protease [Planctomycetota bacterium]